MGAAQEQGIAEEVAKARKRMADGRLAEAQVGRDGRGAPAAGKLAEHQEQAAIHAADIVFVDVSHDPYSVA
jgi:hypothetical protein